MKGKMQNMGSRYRTWGPEVEFRMQRWDIGQEMEYKIQMKDVQGMGCRRGIWDTGHRRWDVEAGHGMQKWDVGCRYGMEVQDMGCCSTRAPQLSPGSAQGSSAPLEMGSACNESGNPDFQGKSYRFPIPYRHFAARPPSGRQIPAIWPHLPARCAGEGNRAPVDGKPPLSPVCRPGWECSSAISHLLWRKAWMEPGSSGKEGLDGTSPASQKIFIVMKVLSCAWGRWQ